MRSVVTNNDDFLVELSNEFGLWWGHITFKRPITKASYKAMFKVWSEMLVGLKSEGIDVLYANNEHPTSTWHHFCTTLGMRPANFEIVMDNMSYPVYEINTGDNHGNR